MAEVALTSIAKSALQLFSSLAKDEFLLLWNSEKELKRLEDTIDTIGCLLQDADKLQSKGDVVRKCLSRLRNIMYDADDFFDALAAKVLRRKTMGRSAILPKEGGKWVHDIPWKCLASLEELCLEHIGGMEYFPEGIQHLSSLRSLSIEGGCEKVRSLPEWFPQLASLEWLKIRDCSEDLRKRCERDKGEDWPLIRHITDSIEIIISVPQEY